MVYRVLKFIKRYIDKALKPLLLLAFRLGVRPTHITVLSIPCGILGVILMFQGTIWGPVLVISYVVLDVLDGSLARVAGCVTDVGDKLDSIGDRLVAVTFLVLYYFDGGSLLFSATAFLLIIAISLEDLGLIKR